MKTQSKKFKVLIAGLAATVTMLLAVPGVAENGQGQGHHHRGKHGAKMMEKMSSELNLTSEQQAQIKTIFESHKDNFKQLREQMKSTFTEEQRQAMKEARKNRRGAKDGRPSKEERAQKMAELGISEGQRAQMQSLRQQMKQEREQIKTEIMAVLTPDQQAKFEEMKAQRKRHHKGRHGKRQQQQQ